MTESEDLPDWTKESHLTVTVVDEAPAEITVVQPDETKLLATVTQDAKDRTITGNVNVIAHPSGELTEEGAGVATNTSTYTSIVSRTITSGKKYHLGKIEVPMVNAHWIQIEVDGSVVKTYYVGTKDTFAMFYLWDEVSLTGDGSKKVDVKAKAVDTVETLYGYMSGEEV